MKELYFEIGTQEIPAEYFPGLLDQVKEKTEWLLNKYKLGFSGICVYGTPRRLVVHVGGVEEGQKTEVKEILGPPEKAAYAADGTPTKAAMGFARSKGMDVEDLRIVETEKGAFVALTFQEKGKTTVELIPLILGELIQGIKL